MALQAGSSRLARQRRAGSAVARRSGFGLLGLALWSFVVLPWALRDSWRRVPAGPLDPLRAGDGLVTGRPPEVGLDDSIQGRTPPARW
jgi:hypothetical protein